MAAGNREAFTVNSTPYAVPVYERFGFGSPAPVSSAMALPSCRWRCGWAAANLPDTASARTGGRARWPVLWRVVRSGHGRAALAGRAVCVMPGWRSVARKRPIRRCAARRACPTPPPRTPTARTGRRGRTGCVHRPRAARRAGIAEEAGARRGHRMAARGDLDAVGVAPEGAAVHRADRSRHSPSVRRGWPAPASGAPRPARRVPRRSGAGRAQGRGVERAVGREHGLCGTARRIHWWVATT